MVNVWPLDLQTGKKQRFLQTLKRVLRNDMHAEVPELLSKTMLNGELDEIHDKEKINIKVIQNQILIVPVFFFLGLSGEES